MSQKMKIGQFLKEVEMSRHEFLKWESSLVLTISTDEKGHRVFDEYWVKYFRELKNDLAEAGIELEDMLRWQADLKLALPLDRGNRCLNRDWIRYFQEVREKFDQGKDLYWVAYNIKTPNQVRPQYAHQSALGPEY